MWVAHSVAPNVRRKELSWSHHREVAKLVQDDQKTMLEAAVADNLSVSELRALIRKDNKKEKGSKVEVYKEALEEVLVLAKNSPPNCLARILIVVSNVLGIKMSYIRKQGRNISCLFIILTTTKRIMTKVT